ncbi:CBS domain-containing protein [Rhodopseudomonas palustris]|uniref:Putative signal-transduction protein with CBS domains n=1 Tax=Rhodopseudomonas palustris (strain BisB18) TaxID=316056 RepID=Q21BQ3_RHOPB
MTSGLGNRAAVVPTIERLAVKVREVMSTKVVTVGPEDTARSVAQTLLHHGISAVPVVDDGRPIGIVSEGDLMPRNDADRQAGRDWWLRMLSQGQEQSSDYLEFLNATDRTAREVMTSPVVSVDEDADLVEVAELLSSKRIKRVPVLRDGKLVGIVSRADLVRAFAHPVPAHQAEPVFDDGSRWPVASERLQQISQHAAPPPPPPPQLDIAFSAKAFHDLTLHFEEEEDRRRHEEKHRAEEKHHQQADKFLAQHLTEEAWKRMLSGARATAMKGEQEHLLLRFPCEVCSDHGRAVNAPDPSWPETLRGMAAEVFMRWKTELRDHGFALHARVVEFPDGVPGDIGLFLAW